MTRSLGLLFFFNVDPASAQTVPTLIDPCTGMLLSDKYVVRGIVAFTGFNLNFCRLFL